MERLESNLCCPSHPPRPVRWAISLPEGRWVWRVCIHMVQTLSQTLVTRVDKMRKCSQVLCCDESCSALHHILPCFPGNIQIRKKCVSVSCLVVSDSATPRSLLGSPAHGILQARILEWVAISFSRGTSWPRGQTRISYIGRQILYHWAIGKPNWHIRK